MLKRASCPTCNTSLPLGPKLFRLNPAPRVTTCPKCAASIRTTYAYRATWLEMLLWKVVALFSFGLGIVSLIAAGETRPFLWVLTPLTTFALGLLGGFLVGLIVAPILQLVIDAFAWVWRKVAGSSGS